MNEDGEVRPDMYMRTMFGYTEVSRNAIMERHNEIIHS
jgi:hypothetical protein